MEKHIKPLKMLLIVCIMLFFVISVFPQENSKNSDTKYIIQRIPSFKEKNTNIAENAIMSIKSGYENHSPILIDGNNDFHYIASLESWDGDGSEQKPYSITNLNITNQTSINLIEIKNTDLYFNISNNLLIGGTDGIKLDNVTNGLIINNQIANNTSNGIFLKDSIENSIQNNVVKFSPQSGIVLENSSSCKLINNDISNTSTAYYTIKGGITIKNSSLCVLSDNIVRYSSDRAVIIDLSPNCTLFDNTLLNNEWTGFQITQSKFTNLTKNTIEYGRTGISLFDSNNSLIYKNILFHAELHSSSTSHCNVIGNVFYNQSTMDILIGEYFNILNNIFYRTMNNELNIVNSEIHWNDFITNEGYIGHLRECCDNNISHNFYDDWTAPDDNNDGIVDIPYKTEYVEDEFPLTEPYNPSPIHYVTTPNILSPKGERTEVNETVTVSWTKSFDSFDHGVSYSIYYVSNPTDYSNLNWTEIASDLTTTSYQWDTSSIEVSGRTFLRVVAHCEEDMGSAEDMTDEFRIDNQHLHEDVQSPGFVIPSLLFAMITTILLRFKKKKDS